MYFRAREFIKLHENAWRDTLFVMLYEINLHDFVYVEWHSPARPAQLLSNGGILDKKNVWDNSVWSISKRKRTHLKIDKWKTDTPSKEALVWTETDEFKWRDDKVEVEEVHFLSDCP